MAREIDPADVTPTVSPYWVTGINPVPGPAPRLDMADQDAPPRVDLIAVIKRRIGARRRRKAGQTGQLHPDGPTLPAVDAGRRYGVRLSDGFYLLQVMEDET